MQIRSCTSLKRKLGPSIATMLQTTFRWPLESTKIPIKIVKPVDRSFFLLLLLFFLLLLMNAELQRRNEHKNQILTNCLRKKLNIFKLKNQQKSNLKKKNQIKNLEKQKKSKNKIKNLKKTKKTWKKKSKTKKKIKNLKKKSIFRPKMGLRNSGQVNSGKLPKRTRRKRPGRRCRSSALRSVWRRWRLQLREKWRPMPANRPLRAGPSAAEICDSPSVALLPSVWLSPPASNKKS